MTKLTKNINRFQKFLKAVFLLIEMPLRALKSLVLKKSLRTFREKYTILKEFLFPM